MAMKFFFVLEVSWGASELHRDEKQFQVVIKKFIFSLIWKKRHFYNYS